MRSIRLPQAISKQTTDGHAEEYPENNIARIFPTINSNMTKVLTIISVINTTAKIQIIFETTKEKTEKIKKRRKDQRPGIIQIST